jgi:hypothetical protein
MVRTNLLVRSVHCGVTDLAGTREGLRQAFERLDSVANQPGRSDEARPGDPDRWGKIQARLGEVVRSTVEETLNALDAEADRLCRAERCEHTEGRMDTRAGSYQRQLQTQVGQVSLKVPKLRTLRFETAIIERYQRRESSVEEALVEMYLGGVSVRRVEGITEALWGPRVSPSTVSELNQKIYAQIEVWRNRPIEVTTRMCRLPQGVFLLCPKTPAKRFRAFIQAFSGEHALRIFYRNRDGTEGRSKGP